MLIMHEMTVPSHTSCWNEISIITTVTLEYIHQLLSNSSVKMCWVSKKMTPKWIIKRIFQNLDASSVGISYRCANTFLLSLSRTKLRFNLNLGLSVSFLGFSEATAYIKQHQRWLNTAAYHNTLASQGSVNPQMIHFASHCPYFSNK